jgi:uncharacterized protein
MFGQTMGLVAVTAALFTVGAYLARNLSGGWGLVFWIASFGCLLAMNVTIRQSPQLTLGLLFGFGLLVGLATAPTISYYANVDPEAVWEAGGAAAPFVAGFGAAGYATRRDLSALARVLLTARRCWRPRSSSTSSTSSSSSSVFARSRNGRLRPSHGRRAEPDYRKKSP